MNPPPNPPPAIIWQIEFGANKTETRTPAGWRHRVHLAEDQGTRQGAVRLGMPEQGRSHFPELVRIEENPCAGEVLSQTVRDSLLGKITAEETTDRLFPLLFEGSLYDRRRAYGWLRWLGNPSAVLSAGLRAYRLYGYEGHLNEAVSLLTDLGAASWPALRRWAQRGGPESEALVDLIVTLPGVPDQERLQVLASLAMSPDESTRRRILEAVGHLPPNDGRALLSRLARSDAPEDDVKDEARELIDESKD
jgi:hypothetical protein